VGDIIDYFLDVINSQFDIFFPYGESAAIADELIILSN